MTQLEFAVNHFLLSLSQCDEELFLKLGKFVREIQTTETQLDHLLHLIKDDKLKSDYPLIELKVTQKTNNKK
jgi:hypothetical protein